MLCFSGPNKVLKISWRTCPTTSLPTPHTTTYAPLSMEKLFLLSRYPNLVCIVPTNCLPQAPSGTQLEVPRPELLPGRPPKYQIHLKSESGQINVLLVNKEAGCDPVVVQVPPPKEIAEAIKHEAADVHAVQFGGKVAAAAATLLGHGLKRERDSLETVGGSGKRGRYEESEPGSDGFGEESYSDRDNSLEGAVTTMPSHIVKVGVPQDFAMPNIQTDIPGLEDLMSSESKQFLHIVMGAVLGSF